MNVDLNTDGLGEIKVVCKMARYCERVREMLRIRRLETKRVKPCTYNIGTPGATATATTATALHLQLRLHYDTATKLLLPFCMTFTKHQMFILMIKNHKRL